ncbi:MAG: RnfABCDGE type electron transport complex subunit D [Oscillospiraceae bacterium]|nr:RnfABCDGE type electron transport complex subunit D [Oscillospiraceae bacterium]
MSQLALGVSPHLRSNRTTQKVMLDVIIALVPALIASVIFFGVGALIRVVISAAFCVFFEWGWEKLMKTPVTVCDLSAVVTGILIAYNVPSGMPVWQLIVGDFCAIIGVKMLFGGLGCNFMNPALVGRIVMMFSFTTSMTSYKYIGTLDALSSATPLGAGTLGWDSFLTLFLGNHAGVLGETSALAILIGGIYLCVRKVIKPIIPLCYLGSLALFSWIFGGSTPILSIFMGGAMLGAWFMATDYVTSPFTNKGKVIFGLGCGFVTAAIRVFGNYAEGVTFAILLMNLFVPYINNGTRSKPLGGVTEK